jgi:hypothetical protein
MKSGTFSGVKNDALNSWVMTSSNMIGAGKLQGVLTQNKAPLCNIQ